MITFESFIVILSCYDTITKFSAENHSSTTHAPTLSLKRVIKTRDLTVQYLEMWPCLPVVTDDTLSPRLVVIVTRVTCLTNVG